MSWYSARLLYEAVHPEEDDDGSPFYEETIILVDAIDEEQATMRAQQFGRGGEHSYKNAYGKAVEWMFVEILGLCELLDVEIKDGSEVYRAFLNDEALEHLRGSLNLKFEDN